MADDDVRVARWNLRASAGTTVTRPFTATTAVSTVSAYTGGTIDDVDDLTDATEHPATVDGDGLGGTLTIAVPEAPSVPLRLVVDGVVVAVGQLTPSTTGQSSGGDTITIGLAEASTLTLDLPSITVGADLTDLEAQVAALDAEVHYLETQRLASGESNIPRLMIGGGTVSGGTGTLRLGYFTATKTEACTKITSYSASPAAAGLTFARMGVYSVAADGTLTLEAACATDTTLWTATSTAYQRTLTTTFNKVAGQRYALALIATGTTGPTVHGTIPGSAAIGGLAPRLTGAVFGQTDLPASVAGGSVSDTSVFPFMFVAP